MTDTEVEDDIDAAVAQYKEQIQVATVDSSVAAIPTPATARRACLAMGVLLLAVVVAAMTGILGWQDGNTHPVLIGLEVVSLVVAVMMVVVLRCVPTLKPLQAAAFTVPASPWLPAAALLLNVILLVQSLRHSWLFMILYMTSGTLFSLGIPFTFYLMP